MKKLLSLLLALMLLCTAAAAEGLSAGAWQLPEDTAITEEAQTAFDKAMEKLVGVSYTPLALPGTQLVSGMNYCILCRAVVVYPDAQPYYALVYVYADLEGSAQLTQVVPLDIAALAEALG